jgi:hypothetical protein
MTIDPVLVFAFESELSPSDRRLDLRTTPEHLVDMWGTASFALQGDSSSRADISAICIGGGILYSQSDSGNGTWHWSVEKTIEFLKSPFQVPKNVGLKTRIRIGAMARLNNQRPLNNQKGGNFGFSTTSETASATSERLNKVGD